MPVISMVTIVFAETSSAQASGAKGAAKNATRRIKRNNRLIVTSLRWIPELPVNPVQDLLVGKRSGKKTDRGPE